MFFGVSPAGRAKKYFFSQFSVAATAVDPTFQLIGVGLTATGVGQEGGYFMAKPYHELE